MLRRSFKSHIGEGQESSSLSGVIVTSCCQLSASFWTERHQHNLGATATVQFLLKPKHKRQHQHASLTERGGSSNPAKDG